MPKEELIKSTKVLVAHQDETLCAELASMLGELGYQVIGTCNSREKLQEVSIEKAATLIVTGMQYDDGLVVDSLLELAEDTSVPAIIIAKQVDLGELETAMEDHVMGYLIDPVDKKDLETTCYLVLRRFQQFQELLAENKELKETLLARKKIERAKGIVMKKYEISEEDAYLRIRNAATKQRIKMIEVADIIIESVLWEYSKNNLRKSQGVLSY